jgi:hypothetical protein
MLPSGWARKFCIVTLKMELREKDERLERLDGMLSKFFIRSPSPYDRELG